jgi:protein-export membrane protein SecD
MQQSVEIVRRRVDEAGTREPTIQRQGADRILIQVPGIGSGAGAEGPDRHDRAADLPAGGGPHRQRGRKRGAAPAGPAVDGRGGVFYILEQTPVVTGDDLTDSQPSFDQQTGQPVVTFRFNPTGARAFGEYTAANVGAPFAIVLDNEVISAPVIRQAITGGSGQITGNFTVEEARPSWRSCCARARCRPR